ncbi:MAG TPA: hypothetical protein VII58_00900 [Acidobacteriaceae bacterium]
MKITKKTWNGYIDEATSDDGVTTVRMGDTDSDYRLVAPEGWTSEEGVLTAESIAIIGQIKAHNSVLDAAKIEANKSTELLRSQLRAQYRRYDRSC